MPPHGPIKPNVFDRYQNLKVRIQWNNRVVAGMSSLRGLTPAAPPVCRDESGSGHAKPGTQKCAPLTLKRGISYDREFQDWANLINVPITGKVRAPLKKNLVIELPDEKGAATARYRVRNTWVSDYQALPGLDASGNGVAIINLVIQNEGWEKEP